MHESIQFNATSDAATTPPRVEEIEAELAALHQQKDELLQRLRSEGEQPSILLAHIDQVYREIDRLESRRWA